MGPFTLKARQNKMSTVQQKRSIMKLLLKDGAQRKKQKLDAHMGSRAAPDVPEHGGTAEKSGEVGQNAGLAQYTGSHSVLNAIAVGGTAEKQARREHHAAAERHTGEIERDEHSYAFCALLVGTSGRCTSEGGDR